MNDIIQKLYKSFHSLRRFTKYGIFAILLLCISHCGLLYFGYDLFSVHALFCVFALILGLKLSNIFGLCWIHKLYVVYICLVLLCVVMRRHGMFAVIGIDIHAARGLMWILGMILLLCTLWMRKD